MNLNPTSSPTTGISTISTLPDEILQLIVDDLDNLSTCQLSITCRRLHFFALQIFFERNGLGSLGEGVFSCSNPPREAIQAARVALFVQNLFVIDFCFSEDLSRLFSDSISLRRLISRVSPTKRVTLRFKDTFTQGNIDVHGWEKEFTSLLDTIMEQPCEALEVMGGNSLPGFYAPTNNARMLTPYRPPANVDNTHKISFHSAILFTSPFVFWTTATLQARSNSITTLSLVFAGISWHIWCGIVALKFDNLQTLQLRFTDNPGERSYSANLLKFLSRHPTITCLTLSRDFVPPPPPLNATILPLLSKLTAHATCVVWLMSGPKNSYPQLKSVEVTSEQLHRGYYVPYTAFQVDGALKSLASDPHDRTIILSFFSREGLKVWFQKHIDRGDASLLASLHNLKRLGLKFNPCDIFKENPTDIFPRWLALFPGLEQVVFQDDLQALSEVPKMEEFVTSVIRGSPALKSVALGTSVAALRGDDDVIHISRSHNDVQIAWRGF
ncbi:uncharacterized protein LACBIDRAFT_295072 [Laccaria bicolor S238N-H82]|uniref:Predicted protein n=1 Tax=Laccaria bicolor (strain S238N-H82 / ATCC MYA-4686) TaxID=486041 RepID=B0DMC4_LACBS|nr:uncharacterized protein LACBIDRAFT_295072 [Laccaria bicolor S238N-H82]EDR04258.1 predicted protein [Laccaria bicolor S238N-H82]|eukprot:XP_001885149.1 predicted protein [Laccaria bicolor S238N-H82]